MSEGPWPRWGRVSPSEQKAFVLKQGEEGTPVVEVCRKAGISQLFSPGIWWMGFRKNLYGSDVQILQMYL